MARNENRRATPRRAAGEDKKEEENGKTSSTALGMVNFGYIKAERRTVSNARLQHLLEIHSCQPGLERTPSPANAVEILSKRAPRPDSAEREFSRRGGF